MASGFLCGDRGAQRRDQHNVSHSNGTARLVSRQSLARPHGGTGTSTESDKKVDREVFMLVSPKYHNQQGRTHGLRSVRAAYIQSISYKTLGDSLLKPGKTTFPPPHPVTLGLLGGHTET